MSSLTVVERGIGANMVQIIAIATHGILSGNAIDTVNNSCLSQLVVTNTVPLGDKLERCPKMKVIDVSGTLAEAIRRYVAHALSGRRRWLNRSLELTTASLCRTCSPTFPTGTDASTRQVRVWNAMIRTIGKC